MKTGFEQSPAYNAIAALASLKKGGMESFSFAEDTLLWKPEMDVIVPITKEDRQEIKKLSDCGFKIPKIVDSKELIQRTNF